MKTVEWTGSTTCDICGKECGKELVDGKTFMGAWATMCKTCASRFGIGLGTGQGQLYEKSKDGKWLKKVG